MNPYSDICLQYQEAQRTIRVLGWFFTTLDRDGMPVFGEDPETFRVGFDRHKFWRRPDWRGRPLR